MATPAKISAATETPCGPFENRSTVHTESSAPPKAHMATHIDSSAGMSGGTMVILRAAAAAAAAPPAIPIKPGSASGLRTSPCIAQPDTARSAPISIVMITLGSLISDNTYQ